jgi:tRNA threonylcarbamoyl adenosine modification protein (Sua5/YciO/YrdC/YwlC family)
MRLFNWERERARAVLEAVWALKEGRLVVYPTDTLYGLAADPAREECVTRVNQVKGRPPDQPLSVCIPEIMWLKDRVEDMYFHRAKEMLPGPVTLLVPVKERIPAMGRSPTLGVRLVEHPVVKEITARFGPVTATSANRHGEEPPVTCQEAVRQLGDHVEVYIDAGPTRTARASKVISLLDDSVARD